MGKTAAWIFLFTTAILAAFGIYITIQYNKEKKKSGTDSKLNSGPVKPDKTAALGTGIQLNTINICPVDAQRQIDQLTLAYNYSMAQNDTIAANDARNKIDLLYKQYPSCRP